jgi:hypothetical protein
LANEVTLRIGADPTKLKNGLKQSSAAIDSFGSKARASIARVGSSFKGLADRMVTPFTSLVLGGSIGMAIKNVGDLSESLMYYGFAAKKSDADTKVFRDSLHKMAVETGVDANSILNGVSKIGEVTGDFKFSEDMGEVLAKTSKAANTSMEDLALLSSAINANVGWGAKEISEYFNSLIIQGDQGSFTLQKFAQEGKALFSSASAFGIKSKEQFAYFGAMLQTIAPSIKSEAEITTSVGALFRDLKDKQDKLGKKGIKIFDKVDGKNQVRDFKSIIDDIMKYVNGDQKKLAQLGLTSESMKVLNPLMADYQENWSKMKAITDSGLNGMKNTNVLEDRFKKASDSFFGNIGKMKAVASEFADQQLTGPVEGLTNALKYLNEHQGLVTAGFTAMKYAAMALVAVKIGSFVKQVGGLAMDIKGIWSKKSGNAAADAIEAAAGGVQKVFVVNMGGGMGNANYMDDDLPTPIKKSSETVAQTTKEVGRFRQGLSSARAGLNKLGSSPLAMSVMGAATSWAMGQIYNFGEAFIEWRRVVENSNETGRKIIEANAKSFEERYGKNAHAKRHDETLKAIQEEENSFLPSQKKLNKLYAQLSVSRELMKRDIADGSQRVTAKDYMQQFTVAPNIVINLDTSNNNFNAHSDGGKPANIRVKNTPGMGR